MWSRWLTPNAQRPLQSPVNPSKPCLNEFTSLPAAGRHQSAPEFCSHIFVRCRWLLEFGQEGWCCGELAWIPWSLLLLPPPPAEVAHPGGNYHSAMANPGSSWSFGGAPAIHLDLQPAPATEVGHLHPLSSPFFKWNSQYRWLWGMSIAMQQKKSFKPINNFTCALELSTGSSQINSTGTAVTTRAISSSLRCWQLSGWFSFYLRAPF